MRPEFPVDRQCLMRPPLDSEAPSDHPVLGDECTLNACGLGDGASLELLVQEIELRHCDLKLRETIESACCRINWAVRPLDAQSCAVIAMALGNEVRNSMFISVSCFIVKNNIGTSPIQCSHDHYIACSSLTRSIQSA
jgi:hypothetical protein